MKKLLVSLAVIALAASHSHAGNVQTFGVGARATAQSEAVAAHSNTPFAVYYNPAGLTLIERPVITAGIMVYDAVVEIENFSIIDGKGDERNIGATDFESNGDLIYNPSIGFAMPLTDKLSFGIAAYAPYGLHVEWDRDPVKNPGTLYSWESKYVREAVSPTLAYKFSDKLSVGFGVSLGKSICDSGKTMPVLDLDPKIQIIGGKPIPTNPNLGKPIGTSELAMTLEDDFNYSFNAGIMFRPVDAFSLGVTYRGRADADFEGDIFLDSEKIGTGTMDYDHPESVQAGARLFLSDTFSMEIDATWTRWSIIEEQVENIESAKLLALKNKVRALKGEAPLPADTIIPFAHDRDWEDVIQYKIGMEWKAADSFTLRAGYTYDPTPVPDETLDMGWPDTDRNVYNIGFGWDINDRWTVDGVVQHVRSTSVRHMRGDSEDMNEAYSKLAKEPVKVSMDDEGILWGYGLNLSYKF